jgi:hypothetical protein
VSYQATEWVRDHSTARNADKSVLLAIATHARKDGTGARLRTARIAEEAGVSQRAVQRAIARLSNGMGELVADRDPRGFYRFTIPGLAPAAREASQPTLWTEDLATEGGPGDIPPNPIPADVTVEEAPECRPTRQDVATTRHSVAPIEDLESGSEPVREPETLATTSAATAPVASPQGRRKLSPEESLARTRLKDALVEASDYQREFMTASAWGRVEKAAKEVHEAGFGPGDVSLAAELFRDRYPDAGCTPQAIAGALPCVNQWLANPPRRRAFRR